MVTKEVFEREATVDQWNDDYYHPIAIALYDRAVSDMLRWMEVEQGATVLDAGCGPGVHSVRVAAAGHRVCAIDISDTMLRRARQRVQETGLVDKVEFRQEDLTKLSFPDCSFRYVFSWGVVIHIPDAEKSFDELVRILQPGGRLALYLTNKSAVDGKIESFARFALKKRLKDVRRAPIGDGVWYHMSGEPLWLWRFDTEAVTRYLAKRGVHVKMRHIGELSEIQRRLRGLPRRILLHLNNVAYGLAIPPRLGAATLSIFEKESG